MYRDAASARRFKTGVQIAGPWRSRGAKNLRMDVGDAHARISPVERAGIIAAGCGADMAINFPLCVPCAHRQVQRGDKF